MRTLILTLLLTLPAASPQFATLEQRALRPAQAAFRWQEIPWHTDAKSALDAARAEKRPLFVWMAGGRDRDGTPLERC